MSAPFPPKEVRDARRARSMPLAEPAKERANDALALAKAFRTVYGTTDGMIVLEHVMTKLCMIDVPFKQSGIRSGDELVARATQFDIGYEIHRLIHAAIDERPKQPVVKTKPKDGDTYT